MALVRADGVLETVVDGKAVLIGSSGTHVVDLNAVGTIVWSGLDGARGLPELVELVRAAMADPDEVPRATIEADVSAFLAELSRLELVKS